MSSITWAGTDYKRGVITKSRSQRSVQVPKHLNFACLPRCALSGNWVNLSKKVKAHFDYSNGERRNQWDETRMYEGVKAHKMDSTGFRPYLIVVRIKKYKS